MIGGMSALAGLIGLHMGQRNESGKWGWFSFVVALLGTVLLVLTLCIEAFVVATPTLEGVAPENVQAELARGLREELTGFMVLDLVVIEVLFAAGWVLFGLVVYSTNVYSRRAAVLLVIGAVPLVLSLPPAQLIFHSPLGIDWLPPALVLGVLMFTVALIRLGHEFFTLQLLYKVSQWIMGSRHHVR